MKVRSSLCRALQIVPNTSCQPNGSDGEVLNMLRLKGISSGIRIVLCWGPLICWPFCIRFTSSPKLADPKWNEVVLFYIPLFMSASNSSNSGPEVLSQSPGNFYWITVTILTKTCRGEVAFPGLSLQVYFERINGTVLLHWKYYRAALQPALAWLSLELSLHQALNGSLWCNSLLKYLQRGLFSPSWTTAAIPVWKLLDCSTTLVLHSAWPLSH